MNDKLQLLNSKIIELISVCDELSEQNKNLVYERNKLIEKNLSVHDKIQSMIKKIKSIESGTENNA